MGSFASLTSAWLQGGSVCLCLLPAPAMWLPRGSHDLHWGDSAGTLERESLACWKQRLGGGGVKEAAFLGSAGPGGVGRAPTWTLIVWCIQKVLVSTICLAQKMHRSVCWWWPCPCYLSYAGGSGALDHPTEVSPKHLSPALVKSVRECGVWKGHKASL